ncbi:MAG: hypothetical protein KDI28_03850 [Pseudomonadales bacterium]|nr:hypothetical protein [Pseudomonadales bacterium]MCP5357999.1 NnrU family protein [Pseudomonadales bacterium]
MLVLILGLALFFGLHLLRELGLRQRLITRIGLQPYKGVVALGILLSLGLIVAGKASAPFVQVWVPPYSLRPVTHMLMISSCILLVAGALPYSHTRALIIHPMLAGVIVWGSSHLLSNGDLASVLLFGSFSLWALGKIITLELHHVSQRPPSRPALIWDAAAIVAGMIVYTVLLVFHGPLFGFALLT